MTELDTIHTAAITGAARGIGRATADAFLSAGVDVAIGDIDEAAAQATVADLQSAHPGRLITAHHLDVTDTDAIARFLDDARSALDARDGLDVVVNNAGIMPTTAFPAEDAALTDQIIDINFRGVIHGTKLALAHVRPGGVIVSLASQVVNLPAPALATYTATKAGVLGLQDALGRELEAAGTDVRLISVLPGIIRTELSAGSRHRRWLNPVLVADPEDVARAIVAAVGGRARRVTVPRALGPLTSALGALPYRPRRVVERLLGLDTAFTDADPKARAAYEARVIASRSSGTR